MAWFGMIIMMFDLLVVAPHFKRVSRIFSRSTAPIHGKGAFGQLSAASSGSGFKGLGLRDYVTQNGSASGRGGGPSQQGMLWVLGFEHLLFCELVL